VRRAEYLRKGKERRALVKGERWLLLSRRVNLSGPKKQMLNELFRLNRKMMKVYLAQESLDRLWTYRYEGAALRYLNEWIDQLRWQRLEPFQKLARILLRHQEGILNYCRVKAPFGVVEAVNGNIKAFMRRGRGNSNLGYLLLKSQRMASLKTEFVVFRQAAKNAHSLSCLLRAENPLPLRLPQAINVPVLTARTHGHFCGARPWPLFKCPPRAGQMNLYLNYAREH